MPFYPSLQGTLANTLRGEELVGPQPQGDPLTDSVLGGNLASMSGLMGFQQDQANEPPPKIKMETDEKGQPQWTVGLTDSQMKGITGKMSYIEKALMAMTDEVNRYKAMEDRARQNPLLHVLSTVAGNLAAGDPRLPPVVSALGRASLQLNPPPEALAARRMGLEEQVAETAGKGATVQMEGVRLGAQLSEQQLRREEATKQRQDTFLTHELDKANLQQFDEKTFIAEAVRQGFTQPEAAAYAKHLSDAQAGAKQRALENVAAEAKVRGEQQVATLKAEAPIKEEEAKKASKRALANEMAMEDYRNLHREDKPYDKRSDRSYEQSTKQLDEIDKPIRERSQRLGTLQDTVRQRTPQADALVAPELLTVMAGGQGSGLRMNEAEIARIVNGRTNWESIKAAANKWRLNPEKGLSLTPSQREQVERLVDTVANKLAQKRAIIDDAREKLINSPDPEQHKRIIVDTRKNLTAIDSGIVAPSAAPGPSRASQGVYVYDPKKGVTVKQ